MKLRSEIPPKLLRIFRTEVPEANPDVFEPIAEIAESRMISTTFCHSPGGWGHVSPGPWGQVTGIEDLAI